MFNIVKLDIRYSNAELWEMAESEVLFKGLVVEDKEGNQLIFTGKSFQVYYSNSKERYIGFCKGDEWKIVGIDEDI